MDDLGNVRLDQLTAEMAWIRRLAQALVKDASTADDVAQDAWLAAREHVPADRPLRPWLSRVVLNLVRMRARAATRRSVREHAADQPAPVESDTAELIDRVEVQRAVAGEVLALDEPYRATVLLRYFEGLSSAAIARRQGVPEGTVRRRLKTAIDRLRERLAAPKTERRGGWLAALVPLAAADPGPTATLGGIAVKKLIIGLALLALLLVGGLWMWKGRGGGGSDDNATAQAGGAGGLGGAKGGVAGTTGASADALALRPWHVQRDAPPRKIAGHVRYRGEPVAGAVVRLGSVVSDFSVRAGVGAGLPAREINQVATGADGAFDFGMLPAAALEVSAEAAGRAPTSLQVAANDPKQPTDDLVLELGDCRSRLFGNVVDASGGGVPKARLTDSGLGGTTAGPGGEYSLCVAVGQSTLRIEADGYGALQRDIQVVGEMRFDFELVPESVLAGRVVDDANRPVAHARVFANPSISEQPHFVGSGSGIADADGRFRIDGLAPGRFHLFAAADGLGTAVPKLAIATPGTGKEITLVVVRHAQVTGRVVKKSSGEGVSGAAIVIDPSSPLAGKAFSQSDGKFTIDHVPLGKVQLKVAGYEQVSSPVMTIDKHDVENVTIEVADQATLTGRVLRHGKPVVGADVFCPPSGGAARSSIDGTYTLRGLPPGVCQLNAQELRTVFAFAPNKPVTIVAGETNTADIELAGGGEARGVVVDESGKPVPNVYVRMIEDHGDLGESMTDAKGEFHCMLMLGGDYRVSVFPTPGAGAAFAPASGEHPVVTVADGNASVKNVRIAIKHEQLTISGRVVDDTGAIVADVHVEAFGTNPRSRGVGSMVPSIRADANGGFAIHNLARGTYFLHAHAADGSETEMVDVPAGTTGLEIKLARPGSIEGTLGGFATQPKVIARTITPNLFLGHEAIVDGDRFSLTGLVPGKYVVEAISGVEKDGVSVEVKSGTVAKVALKTRGRGTLTGHVLEFGTKAPIPNMRCTGALSLGGQAGAGGNPADMPVSDAKGAFTMPAPVGKVRVMCFDQDNTWSAAGGDVEVTSGSPGQIEVLAVRIVKPPSDPGYLITPMTLPLTIGSVDPQGPAKAAGLRPGDRVVTIDGQPVTGLLPSPAMMLAWNHRPGTTLTLGIERGGTPMTIKIVVARNQQ